MTNVAVQIYNILSFNFRILVSDRKVIELKPIEVAIEDIQLKVTKLDMAIKEWVLSKYSQYFMNICY